MAEQALNLESIFAPQREQPNVSSILGGGQVRPDIQELRDLNTVFGQYMRKRMPEATAEERESLKQTRSQIRGAFSRTKRLPEEESLAAIKSVTEEDTRSTLGTILDTLDVGRNIVAKDIAVPLLGLSEQLGQKEHVYGSDILGGLGMEDSWYRTVLGFGLDVATDPFTYLMPFGVGKKAIESIATKTGEKLLLPKGVNALKKIQQSHLVGKFGTADPHELKGILGAWDKVENATAGARSFAKEEMGRLYDMGAGEIGSDLFHSSGLYAHVPFTKMYKKVFGYEAPKKVIKHFADMPTIKQWTDSKGFQKVLQRTIQPFTIGLMRTPGHTELKAKLAAERSYARPFSETDVWEVLSKTDDAGKTRAVFDTDEAAIESMKAFEQYGKRLSQMMKPKAGRAGLRNPSELLFKNEKFILDDSEFQVMASGMGMNPKDLLKVFQGYKRLGDKLGAIIKEAGGDMDGFLEFYVPHRSKLRGMFEIKPTGKESALTFPFKRQIETLGEFEENLKKNGFLDHVILNPYEAWTEALSSAREYAASQKYVKTARAKGIVSEIKDADVLSAKDIVRQLYPDELPKSLMDTDVFKAQPEPGRYVTVKADDYAHDILLKKIAERDKSLYEFAEQHFNATGTPLGVKVKKSKLGTHYRLIDDRARMGDLAFGTKSQMDEVVKKGYHKRAKELQAGFTTKEILVGGKEVTFSGRITDMQDFEDILSKNIPDPWKQMAAQAWGKSTNFFKRWATVYGGGPVFMSRNAISDMSRTVYDSSIRPFDVKLQSEAIAVATGFNPLTGGKINPKEFVLVNELGEVATAATIEKKFIENGLQSFRLDRADLDRMSNEIKRGINPLTAYKGAMERANVFVENHTKLVNFIGDWKRGMSFERSAEITHEYLYNYKLMPKAVQKSLGFFPFGRWTYLNTKGMIKRFAEQPGKQLGLIRAMDASQRGIPQILSATGISPTASPLTEEERGALPEFYQQDVAIPLYRKASGVGLLTSFDMPISELNELNLRDLSPIKTAKKLLGNRLHPTIKALLELATDSDWFFDAPLSGMIEKESGERKYPFRAASGAIYNMPGLKQIFGTEKKVSRSGDPYYEIDPVRRKMVEATPGLQAILGRPLSEVAKATSQPLTATIPHIMTGTKVYERDMQGYQDKNFGEMVNRINRKLDRLKYEVERRYQK